MGTLLDDFLRETVTGRTREEILAFARSGAGYLEVDGDMYGADLFRDEQVAVVWDEIDPGREERVPLDELVRRVRELPGP